HGMGRLETAVDQNTEALRNPTRLGVEGSRSGPGRRLSKGSPLAVRIGAALPDPEAGARREAGLEGWPAWPGPVVVEGGECSRMLDGLPGAGVPHFTKLAPLRRNRRLQLTEFVESLEQRLALKAAERVRLFERSRAVPFHPRRQPR